MPKSKHRKKHYKKKKQNKNGAFEKGSGMKDKLKLGALAMLAAASQNQ